MSSDNEYMAQYMAQRRKDRRARLVTLLGGVCKRCGKDENLEFDHIVPGCQLFRITGKALDKPWEQLLEEVAKCQLLCHECHRDKTKECGETGGGWNRIDEHGTEAYQQRTKCRCVPCREARRDARIKRGEIKGIRRRNARQEENDSVG